MFSHSSAFCMWVAAGIGQPCMHAVVDQPSCSVSRHKQTAIIPAPDPCPVTADRRDAGRPAVAPQAQAQEAGAARGRGRRRRRQPRGPEEAESQRRRRQAAKGKVFFTAPLEYEQILSRTWDVIRGCAQRMPIRGATAPLLQCSTSGSWAPQKCFCSAGHANGGRAAHQWRSG